MRWGLAMCLWFPCYLAPDPLMKFPCFPYGGWAAILSVLSCAAAFAEPVHPRPALSAGRCPALRARAASEPFTSMLEAVEWMRSHDPFFTATGQDQFHKDFGNPAILYLFTGETAWADLARDETLYYIRPHRLVGEHELLSPCAGVPLSRGASISYDFCYHAGRAKRFPGSVTYRGHTVPVPPSLVGRDLNEVVSEAILQNAQSLMASGGSGWPGAGKIRQQLVCRALQRGGYRLSRDGPPF